jgi:uncharacterized membrane protein
VSAIIALWRDRVFLFWLALALLANLALFGYLVLRFDNLPDPLPMHFDSAGLPDRIESKNGIFALPIIGITIFVLNLGLGVLIHRRERAITILLTVGALFVQVLMWLAIINLAELV